MMWIALSRRQTQPPLTLNGPLTSLYLFNLAFYSPLRLKEPLLYQKLPLCNRPSPTACSFLCVDQRPSFWLTDCAEIAFLSCGKRSCMCSLCDMREIDDDKAYRKAKNSYILNLASTDSTGLGPICIRGSFSVIQSCTPASCLCNVIQYPGRFVLTSCWLASLGKKDHSCTTRHRKAPTRRSDSRVRGYSFRDSRVEGRQSTDFGRGTFGLAEAC